MNEEINRIPLPPETVEAIKKQREENLKLTAKDMAKIIRRKRNEERARLVWNELFPWWKR